MDPKRTLVKERALGPTCWKGRGAKSVGERGTSSCVKRDPGQTKGNGSRREKLLSKACQTKILKKGVNRSCETRQRNSELTGGNGRSKLLSPNARSGEGFESGNGPE